MSRDVFISYRSEDKDWAERICSALEHESLSCWIAPRDIPVGKEWATAIVENLQQCRAFVIILSSNSKNARQIAREAELADKTGLPIITVRVEDVQPPPELLYFLGNVQWLDAFGNQFETAMSRLVQVVRAAEQGKGAAAAVAAAASASPQAVSPSITQASASRPAMAPSAPPETRPAAGAGMGKWIGIGGAAVVLIGAIVWFTAHSSSNTDTATQGGATGNQRDRTAVKQVADQFMSLIQAGDVRGAWQITSPTFQQEQPHFQKAMRTELERDGGATGFKPDGACVYDGSATYRCFYTLSTQQREKHATITIKHTTGWLVEKWVLTG